MGYGSSRQAETQRVSSERIYVRVACYSHIHFMDWERFRTAWLWNAVKDDRVHSSLLSLMALRECRCLMPIVRRGNGGGFGHLWAGKMKKAPRKNRGVVGLSVARRVRHACGHEKAPAVLMAAGAGARGLLDDLHVGADAFRGDVDTGDLELVAGHGFASGHFD